MLHKLNNHPVAQLKILYCLHGEFEKNREKHVRLASLPAQIWTGDLVSTWQKYGWLNYGICLENG